MSDICLHASESHWTGPTPKDVLAAARRSAVRICFTKVATGEELIVRIDVAYESKVDGAVTFSGRSDDDSRIEHGLICTDNSHPGTIHIQLDLVPQLALAAVG